ncbi:MAG: type II toxin-antitoxin system VapC family toxin [Opitutaceae bacterium]
MIALLDTHAAIWALEDDARLGSAARALIESSEATDLCISDMTLLEISMLIRKGRIAGKGSEAALLQDTASKFKALPINASIAAEAFQLDLPQADPFDRIITATARYHGIKLITKDACITESKTIETVW